MSAYENKKGEVEWLPQAAKQFSTTARPFKPGPLRTYFREHFEAVIAMKKYCGFSWPQVAVLLAGRGLTKADGSPLDGNLVAVTAAQVRWERYPRSRRRRTWDSTGKQASLEAPDAHPISPGSLTPAPVVLPPASGDRTDGQALSGKVQDHDELPKGDHRLLP
jgi:hypothetical protein